MTNLEYLLIRVFFQMNSLRILSIQINLLMPMKLKIHKISHAFKPFSETWICRLMMILSPRTMNATQRNFWHLWILYIYWDIMLINLAILMDKENLEQQWFTYSMRQWQRKIKIFLKMRMLNNSSDCVYRRFLMNGAQRTRNCWNMKFTLEKNYLLVIVNLKNTKMLHD